MVTRKDRLNAKWDVRRMMRSDARLTIASAESRRRDAQMAAALTHWSGDQAAKRVQDALWWEMTRQIEAAMRAALLIYR